MCRRPQKVSTAQSETTSTLWTTVTKWFTTCYSGPFIIHVLLGNNTFTDQGMYHLHKYNLKLQIMILEHPLTEPQRVPNSKTTKPFIPRTNFHVLSITTTNTSTSKHKRRKTSLFPEWPHPFPTGLRWKWETELRGGCRKPSCQSWERFIY